MPRPGWSTGCFRATSHPYALGQEQPSTNDRYAALRAPGLGWGHSPKLATEDQPGPSAMGCSSALAVRSDAPLVKAQRRSWPG